jgi:hypothetical protein
MVERGRCSEPQGDAVDTENTDIWYELGDFIRASRKRPGSKTSGDNDRQSEGADCEETG